MTDLLQRPRATQVFLITLFFCPLSGSAASYYVDNAAGRDTNTGLGPQAAWQTIDQVNQRTFGPGDRILLRRGGAWHGSGFKAHGNGSTEAPITLSEYGDSTLPLPLIDGTGPHEPAVLLQNVQNWTVSNLELTQHGQVPQALDSNNE